jgi:hypothetical protein
MVTPASVSRKGPQRLARSRVVRLGVRLTVRTLVVRPGGEMHAASRGPGEPVALVTIHAQRAVPRHRPDVVCRGPADLLARLCRLARLAPAQRCGDRPVAGSARSTPCTDAGSCGEVVVLTASLHGRLVAGLADNRGSDRTVARGAPGHRRRWLRQAPAHDRVRIRLRGRPVLPRGHSRRLHPRPRRPGQPRHLHRPAAVARRAVDAR